MTTLGMIQVYTGNGKGKTTASLGLALRATGHGLKVCMVQFMKDNTEYGEVRASEFLPGFKLVQVGRNDFVNLSDPEKIDMDLAQAGWLQAKNVIHSGEFNLVILDEINVAMACKLIDTDEVVSFLEQHRGKGIEIVLTGRYAPSAIMEMADLVTEMREVRHPFAKGIESREGIEF